MIKKIEVDYYGRPLSIEVGRMAKQADGSALVRYGETVVLATAVADREARRDTDFFPLTVDYQEKTFAAGQAPGRRPAHSHRHQYRRSGRRPAGGGRLRPLFSDG